MRPTWQTTFARKFVAVAAIAILALVAVEGARARDFERAIAPRAWSFPRDHGAHPGYGTEWWYFTGSVEDSAGLHYGYELTFFRVGLRADAVPSGSAWRARDLVLAHFAVTEVTRERFHVHERIQRAAAGMAGADTTRLHVWVGDWSAEQVGDGRFRVQAREGRIHIDLELVSTRPAVLHGEGGLSWKTQDRTQASHYYSLTRLRTTGTLAIDDRAVPVSGTTWMDQEFFTGDTPREGLGWDWFSARLDDGRDLMLYRVRRAGSADAVFGTLVEVDGSARALDTHGARFEPGSTWTSASTGAIYPVQWRIELPTEQILLEVRALLAEQEVHARETVGFAYWEGISRYTGSLAGATITGEGYVELTGYAPAATPPR